MEDLLSGWFNAVDSLKGVVAAGATFISDKFAWANGLSKKQRVMAGVAVFVGVIFILTVIQGLF